MTTRETVATRPELTVHCYSRHPAPVAVVAAEVGGDRQAMVCTSLIAVSMTPPILALSIRKESATWARLREAGDIGISVLAAGQAEVARAIAYAPARDRLTGVGVDTVPEGDAVFVAQSALRYHCAVGIESEVGDHWLVTLPVLTLVSADDRSPLVFRDNAMA